MASKPHSSFISFKFLGTDCILVYKAVVVYNWIWRKACMRIGLENQRRWITRHQIRFMAPLYQLKKLGKISITCYLSSSRIQKNRRKEHPLLKNKDKIMEKFLHHWRLKELTAMRFWAFLKFTRYIHQLL